MTKLIIGLDDKLLNLRGAAPGVAADHFEKMVDQACDDFAGLDVDLKLNVGARAGGHELLQIVQDSGLGLFLDYKLGMDVLDTMWADMRALSGFTCIKRFTFRSDCPVEFLSGTSEEDGACAILPDTKFLPVGPVTDLLPSYYKRMGFADRREAMANFASEVEDFGNLVDEIICAPSDISHFQPTFLQTRRPVTPAVRPVGLGGNSKNDVNAFTVEQAVEAGATAVVIASPIMGAENKRAAAELVLEQLAEADARMAV